MQRLCKKTSKFPKWKIPRNFSRHPPPPPLNFIFKDGVINLATSCWHHTSGCFCHAQLLIRDLVRCAAILRHQKPADSSYIDLRSSYPRLIASHKQHCMPGVILPVWDQVTLFMLSWRITNTNSSHNRSHDLSKVHRFNHPSTKRQRNDMSLWGYWRLSSQLGVLVGHEGGFDLRSKVRFSMARLSEQKRRFF